MKSDTSGFVLAIPNLKLLLCCRVQSEGKQLHHLFAERQFIGEYLLRHLLVLVAILHQPLVVIKRALQIRFLQLRKEGLKIMIKALYMTLHTCTFCNIANAHFD